MSPAREAPGTPSPAWSPAASGEGSGRRGRVAGFTLIETIVVLVILGLALTIVAGFLPRRNTTLELAAASGRVASALRQARARAILYNRPVLVAVSADGHSLATDGIVRPLPAAVAMTMVGPAAIRFAPDGSASGGGILVRIPGRARVIRVEWLTGRVSIAEAS